VINAILTKKHHFIIIFFFKDYLLSDPSGRSTDIPIVVVKQGFEPPNFTGFFGAWDPELFDVSFSMFGQWQ
jgi:hypothetical protein